MSTTHIEKLALQLEVLQAHIGIFMPDVPTVIKCGYGPLVTRVAKLCVELQCAIAMSFVLSEINTIF